MSTTDLEALAWELLLRSSREIQHKPIRFATGDMPLIRAKGHRFERLSPPTADNPRGLWSVH